MNDGDLDTNQEATVHATTGEEHVLELKQMPGLSSADVEAYLTDREEAAKLIDPEKCEVSKHTVHVLDPYGLFDLPDEARCVGRDLFVRNVPGEEWIRAHDLPQDTYRRLMTRLQRTTDDDDEELPW